METSFSTLTGYAREIVEVAYSVDGENFTDLTVTFKGVDVTGILSEDQLDDLEHECQRHYERISLDQINDVELGE